MMSVLSGNLANDVVVEILSRIPVKSVTRFNCVSKSWRELIRSPYFITKHLKKKNQAAIPNHSFVFSGKDSISLLHRHDRILKGDHYLKIYPPSPIDKKERLLCIIIRAIGDGIIYFHAVIPFNMIDFLWNPATRKLKAVPRFDHPADWRHQVYFGVCFCSDSNCVKVVRLQTYVSDHHDDDWKEYCNKAEIWSSVDNSQSWREIDVNVDENLGFQFIRAGQLYIGGTCYWVGQSRESIGGDERHFCRFLVSFDMVNERCNRISLPGGLGVSRFFRIRMVMAELKQSLAIISTTVPNENQGVEVWLMKNEDDKGSSCWSKYCSLKSPFGSRNYYRA